MVKSGTSSKLAWSHFGLGGRSRDVVVPSAPVRVSEDAQAKSIDKKAANLVEFNRQNRDRLPERPSTSAGPASSFAKKQNAEKRETKDDLHLFNPLAVHGRGTTFYNFPLPGSLPTPASSPKESAPSLRKQSLARPSTPESMEIRPAPATSTMMNVPGGEIGMALGSPSHAPAAWQEHSVEAYIRHESPDQMDSSVDGSWENPQLKYKPSRWKILGGIFGGGKKTQPAFYQLQPDGPQRVVEPDVDHVQEPASNEKRPKSRGRGWSNSTRRKNKPEMSRSNTLPAFDMNGGREATATPEITLEGGPLIENASRFAQKGAGLLDVDIPSIQMERYSIMFSGVLQKPQQTSSSLLARRQATLDKLKTVNEALASKEQEIEAKTKLLLLRRATSPSATKTQSPAFSLFPSTPRIRDHSPSSRSLQHPSGSLYRSNTSPAAISPSRPSFAPGLDNEAHAQIMGRTSPEKRRDQQTRANTLENEGGPSTASPTPKPTQWSLEKSVLALDNSEDEDEDIIEIEREDTYDPAPLPMKPKLVEPEWQIINPPHAHFHVTAPSVSGSSISGSSHSTSQSTSSSVSTPPSTGLPVKPNMPSPPLVSVPSPQAQAREARTRAASVSRPTTTRSRSATTTQPASLPRSSPQPMPETIDSPTLHPDPLPSVAATISVPLNLTKPGRTAEDEEETEARLKSLADVSIARQISVSRQQRQLLIPIKTSLKSASSNGSLKRSPGPLSAGGNGNGASIVNVGKVASPLSAVAVAAQEERERASSPMAGQSERVEKVKLDTQKPGEKSTKRLVEGVKPSTPTLVVVGDERENGWAGATQKLKTANVGLAERRRMLAQNAAGNGNADTLHANVHSHAMGEISVGLPVSREHERGTRQRELRDLQNRKSERVVVERISVASN